MHKAALLGRYGREQHKASKKIYEKVTIVSASDFPYNERFFHNYRHAKDTLQSSEATSGQQGGAAAAASGILEVKINVADLKDGE